MAPKGNMQRRSKAPEPVIDFCEHHVSPCVFCGELVRYGHFGKDAMTLIHDEPVCTWFAHCDSPDQFAMFTFLKVKSDQGQLERN